VFLFFFIVASTLTTRAAVAHVGRQYRHRRDRYLSYSRRAHRKWPKRAHRAAARWVAFAYTASDVAHGFPALRRGIHHGVVAHRTARAEGRARHLKDLSEYRRRHAAALEQIRQHEQQQNQRKPQNPWRAARTLPDLGNATADWLEGKTASQPGYAPGHGPDTETTGLIPGLAAANRAGFVTRQSQPG
jgi:hypothetical protein